MHGRGRVYGGRSEAERRADRRARLVEAGLELFGTDGWAGTSIERLCSTAGVATRSFYEEFAGREQLLLAVYDQVLSDAAQAVLKAVAGVPEADGDSTARARAGVAAYVRHLTDDPRRAQVVNREAQAASSAPAVQAHRRATLTRFAELVALEVKQLRGRRDPGTTRVLALALTGAVNEVLSDWVSAPPPRPPVEPIVEELSRLYVAALGGDQRRAGAGA